MKAIQFKSFSGIPGTELVELPDPVADEQSAIVRVHNASINPSDVKNLEGIFEHTILPRVPGRDFSGTVIAGPREWVGTEVWGTGGDVGFSRDGTHAQLIRIPLAALAHKPSSLTHEQASAIGVNFVAAWLGIVDYAKLQRGETVAVVGVSGGVGGAVTQIAKAHGCRVIGVDRVPPEPDSPAGRLLDEYVPIGEAQARFGVIGKADIVYDAVGGIVFETALELVRRRGRVVNIASTGKRRVEFDLIDFYHNETVLMGVDSMKLGVAESAPLMTALSRLFDEGKLAAPIIARRYPLEEAKAGYEAVKSGTGGRVVLTM